MSASQLVLVQVDQIDHGHRVARVTINNPSKLNALNSAVMEAFVSAVEELSRDAAVRAAVVTGAGHKAFVGGADIDEMAGLDVAGAKAFITRVHRCCEVLRELPVPVIARIEGFALGAGLELAAACDLRVATETAQFGMPEVKLGMPSVVEAALLPLLVGWGRAREILLLGELFSASDAAAWGFLQRVVPASALDAAVDSWIRSVVTAWPGAVRLQKRLIRDWEELTMSAAVTAGIGAFTAAYEGGEPAVAIKRYHESRKARE
jgi:enoyl-CoA hydratase/carnithine racemase